MFDSIKISLHGIKKYNMVDLILYDHHSGVRKFQTIDDIPKIRETSIQGEVRQWTQYNDSTKVVEQSYNKKIFLPSSHYEFNYYRNDLKDTYNFDFSIPKYLHATNIFQAIYHEENTNGTPRSDKFNRNLWFGNEINKGNCDVAFHWLMDFIKNKFFKYLFPYVEIDYRDVQISRLDISFNQVFKNKIDALQYLSYQRELRKKYSRDSNAYVRDWRTAISYVGSLYSFKIYHKGSEFETKGDKSKLVNINERLLKEGRAYKCYDIGLLSNFASRILRYELTCHSKYISYLHYQHIFRSGDADFLRDKARYNKLVTILTSDKEVRGKKGFMRLSQGEREFYREFQSLTNKRLDFRLEVDYDSRNYHSTHSANIFIGQAKFTRFHLHLMVKKLHEMFHEFRVDQIPAQNTLTEKLIGFNQAVKEMNKCDERLYELTGEKKKQGLKESVFKAFVHHLYHFGSFEELRKADIYHLRTLQRIVKRCKDLGFNVKNLGDVDKMFVCNDFEEYHNFINLNYNQLRNHFNNF